MRRTIFTCTNGISIKYWIRYTCSTTNIGEINKKKREYSAHAILAFTFIFASDTHTHNTNTFWQKLNPKKDYIRVIHVIISVRRKRVYHSSAQLYRCHIAYELEYSLPFIFNMVNILPPNGKNIISCRTECRRMRENEEKKIAETFNYPLKLC